MAEPTTVNSQITDAINQTNVKVVGEAPAMAMACLYKANSEALAVASQNAVQAQQQSAVLFQTTTAKAVESILGPQHKQADTEA